MDSISETQARTPKEMALQLFAVVGAPVAWAADLILAYSITQHTCSTGKVWELHLATAVFLMIALLALTVSFRTYSRISASAEGSGGSARDRTQFIGMLGLMTSALFAVAIVALAVPRWILSPCD